MALARAQTIVPYLTPDEVRALIAAAAATRKGERDGLLIRLLFETGLRTRYYIPKIDVRMDLLEQTATVTQCPYKGNAAYWSARIGDQVFTDIVWSYPFPIPESTKIQNLLSFYNEKTEIYVDGELEQAPTRR